MARPTFDTVRHTLRSPETTRASGLAWPSVIAWPRVIAWPSVAGALIVGLGLLPSCRPLGPEPAVVRPSSGLNDFTVPRLESLEEFRQMAAIPLGEDEDRPAIAGVKFIITDFSTPKDRKTVFLDGRHYRFHDEWYWFHWIHSPANPANRPTSVPRLSTPKEISQWALGHDLELPQGLQFVEGDRLYSAKFYELGLASGARSLGIGTLIHTERAGGGPAQREIWAFELEYTDTPSAAQVQIFFDTLLPQIPPQARHQLKWIARSPQHQEIAQSLFKQSPDWQNRIASYAELSVPGETEIYSPGIVAGRLHRFPTLEALDTADPDSILVLGAIPDYLPQTRGLLTAIPQTPLAHLNLLAKNRQIVNAYRGGLLNDPNIDQLARTHAPVVISAAGGALKIQRLTEVQYATWQRSREVRLKAAPSVDLSHAPYIIDLSTLGSAQLDAQGAFLGGKASGMVHLLESVNAYRSKYPEAAPEFEGPYLPLAITTRAYHEHLSPMLPTLLALLGDPDFRKDRRLRFLALEGHQRFTHHFKSRKDKRLAKGYLQGRPTGILAQVIQAGGLRRIIERHPLPQGLEHQIVPALRQHFAGLAPTQGLRFRSSSTAEDIEGFNGAGLYESFTGYIEPSEARTAVRSPSTVIDALRRTWSSYYAFEAFEERAQNGIDHLSGDMAVLVHPRFDDALELSNGVFTFTISKASSTLLVNVQPGAISVTNPPTERRVVPESTRLTRSSDGQTHLERTSLSSEVKTGAHVMSSSDLEELFDIAKRISVARLAWENAHLPGPQQRQTLVLDFEFRQVRAGWPALRQGQNKTRYILKQVRPLEPSPEVPDAVRSFPIPHDILARARRIERHHCTGEPVTLSWIQVFTDPNRAPDLGFSRLAFVAEISGRLPSPQGTIAFSQTHLDALELRSTGNGVTARLAAPSPWFQIQIERNQATLTPSAGPDLRIPLNCQVSIEYADPEEMLRAFLESGEP